MGAGARPSESKRATRAAEPEINAPLVSGSAANGPEKKSEPLVKTVRVS